MSCGCALNIRFSWSLGWCALRVAIPLSHIVARKELEMGVPSTPISAGDSGMRGCAWRRETEGGTCARRKGCARPWVGSECGWRGGWRRPRTGSQGHAAWGA
eukprot:6040141-Pyramimonas_sp.AAC.2